MVEPSAAMQSEPAARSGRPAPGEAIVSCQRLTKVFRDFWMRDRARAVDAVTFDIRRHEVFGLLGPNGSGKSTTIKMILGLLKPTGGRISVFGKPPTDVSIKRRIGYLPEESYLYGYLNARETLDYFGKLFELDHRTRGRRVDELLDMIGLSGAQFRAVREYSKGMQRRLGIAQALINDPDFLILDEPTTGLDPIGTRQIKDLILELARRGKTILLCSHLLADVEDVVDRMMILYGGKVRAEGTCEGLLASQTRMSLETETLDDATVAEIDRVLRQRTGQSLLKVARPRQKLEELFLDIVEKAKAEQLKTSGATSGGQTAAFLRGEEQGGEALIERLTRAEAPKAETPVSDAPAQAAPIEAARSVIDDLVGKAPEAPAAAPTPRDVRPVRTPEKPATPKADEALDRSVIDSLLGDSGDGGGSGGASGGSSGGSSGGLSGGGGRRP